MGLFDFGGGKSSSFQESESFSEAAALSESVSGGQAVSGGISTSRQGIAFEDIFAQLFGGATGAAAGMDPSVLTSQANMLFGAGGGFLESLDGGVGTEFLEGRVSGESPVLQEQIAALGGDLGKFFREELDPAITSEAVSGGVLGGGRQGVAQGIATEAVGREFQRGATSLRAADIAARDKAAGVLGQQRIQAAGTGLAGLPALGGLAELGFGAELTPYAALSDILGGPTTLTQADSSQFATSEDFARSFSESFSTSEAKSKGGSKSMNIKFGFG